jgi:hypothetical protein
LCRSALLDGAGGRSPEEREEIMTAQINTELMDNRHRRAFIAAWQKWTTGTAADLAAADTFEKQTAILSELVLCHDVMALIVGEAGES